jgi:uncharacterized protein
MHRQSRRDFLTLLGAAAAMPQGRVGIGSPRPFRVRTITAGIEMKDAADLRPVQSAIAALKRGKSAFAAAGYEVETLRVATSPFIAHLSAGDRETALPLLERLDALAIAHGITASIGPVLAADRVDVELPRWAAELTRTTKNLSFSIVVASPEGGVHARAAAVAAETMTAVATATEDGVANFRFAAAANILPGTPFFPVAYHQGPDAVAVGLESPSLVQQALGTAASVHDATDRLRGMLDVAFAPVAGLAEALARREGRTYLGIDPSPAPGPDCSIGAAIEALTHVPFGSASTLEACAVITAALKTLQARTCGYAGLMLPVLEDPILAQRATEGRYGIRDLLLFSSVCGTGLDVVPIPGDTPPSTVAGLIRDVAALSSTLRKPLSARLFLIPGKKAGEIVRFADPRLTECAVLKVD